jgi:peroxiredoxin
MNPRARQALFALFALVAGILVYALVDVLKKSEMRRSCESIVHLRPKYMGFDRRSPDFDLPDEKGGHVKLSAYRGKVVLLHFWMRTCPPCLDELPHIGNFASRIKARKDVIVIMVSADSPDEDRTFFSTIEPTPNMVWAFDANRAVIESKYGTTQFPETWLLDSDGVIRARWDGPPAASSDSCEPAWESSLLLNAVSAVQSPFVCDIVIDPVRHPEIAVAPCLRKRAE